ncbi:MAG: TlyA family RNA methyltransferase [Butyrivibrio sp.]|nr:TlyA family RNA methyltransferase [Butyrivibrio sp.]
MKERLDILVLRQGMAPSRERARALIMEGKIFVNGEREDKPGAQFDPDKIKRLELRGETLPYVSRGGLKLEKALRVFDIDVSGRICMDVGASTGGFTDVLLQNGAEKVYAVDSGTNQLAWKLRSDPRVVCMEQTNFRYVRPEDIPDRMEMMTADVSFISLDKILPPARALLQPGGCMVCLIKPQFEAGREQVGKKGVVRDPAVHREVIGRVTDMAQMLGFVTAGLDYSPITGPEGNIEYLLYLQTEKEGCAPGQVHPDIPGVVAHAHEELR